MMRMKHSRVVPSRWRNGRAVGAVLLAVFAGFACGVTWAAGPLDKPVHVEIPKGTPLDAALIRLAREITNQTGMPVMVASKSVGHQPTAGLNGTLRARDALASLLHGTGLVYQSTGSTIAITPASASGVADSSSFRAAQSGQSNQRAHGKGGEGGKETTRSQGARPQAGQQAATLEEVVVTAEKREERLQDVPVPVTALSGQALVESNTLRLQDYYTAVPGLSVAPNAQSQELVAIRGITTGIQSNPSVGVVVDDLPYGSSTNTGGGLVVPDIDPSDLARLEVLRGPQGTLYGASSIGGLLKFVTVAPEFDRLSGDVEASTSGVSNGAELGYAFRGGINAPLSDVLAVRASAFTRRDAGYIDNPGNCDGSPCAPYSGVNEVDVYGGHIAALWKPSEQFSLKLSALLQVTHGYGSNDEDAVPGLGDLQQTYVRGTGQFDRNIQTYGATLHAKLGGIDVAAISGYSVNTFSDALDATYYYGQTTLGVTNGVTQYTALPEHSKTDKFSQEIRFSGALMQRLDWLAGAFYTHERSPFEQDIVALNLASGTAVGAANSTSFPTTYEEYAAFEDLTYHFTDQLDVQIGARESAIKQTYQSTTVGPYNDAIFGTPSSVTIPLTSASAHPVTYLFTPRYRLSPDTMVYARIATGYRAGGPNTGFGVPPQYSPDKTLNYEVGFKGDALDHRISLDASVYYIQWKDIQILLYTPPPLSLGYTANAPEAKSEGEEVSVEARPLRGLTIAAWVAWDEAVLTEDFPANASIYGVSGDRLPYSSRFSANFSLNEDFPITAQVTGFVGGSISYVGDRVGEFSQGAERQDLPAYAKTDLRAGATLDSWTVNFFVSNAFDKRGLLTGGLGTILPYSFYYIQPRTVGLSVARSF